MSLIREYYQQLNSNALSLNVEISQRIEDITDQERLKKYTVGHIRFSLPYEICTENETIEFERAYKTLQALKKENIQVASYVIDFLNHTIRILKG